MACVWRPTPNDDVGIDGEIELGKEGTATGQLIKVQVKSGPSYLRNANRLRFDFSATPDDLQYWSGANLPVILVVYDPEKNEAYWKAVQQLLLENPGPTNKGRLIPFSRRKDRFVVGTFVQLCNLVFADEAELTNFLKNRITEPLYSNLLPVLEYPETLYHFQLSESKLAEMHSENTLFPDDVIAHGNGHMSFRDPRLPGSRLAGALLPGTVEPDRSLEFLHNPNTRSKVIGLWNDALAKYLLSLGLQQRDKARFYFPPEKSDKVRELTWTSPLRTPTRKVAYPYLGQQSQKIMFWVHHSLKSKFKNVGGEWFLILEPGYVFTRDGHTFIQSTDAGALSTSRMSQERNYQVINHLYFWAWFLGKGTAEIRIPCGTQNLVVQPELANGVANFGIGTDKKTLTAILNSDYDLNWSDLERETKAPTTESGEEE